MHFRFFVIRMLPGIDPAMPIPMPLVEPVTITTFSFNRSIRNLITLSTLPTTKLSKRMRFVADLPIVTRLILIVEFYKNICFFYEQEIVLFSCCLWCRRFEIFSFGYLSSGDRGLRFSCRIRRPHGIAFYFKKRCSSFSYNRRL